MQSVGSVDANHDYPPNGFATEKSALVASILRVGGQGDSMTAKDRRENLRQQCALAREIQAIWDKDIGLSQEEIHQCAEKAEVLSALVLALNCESDAEKS